MMHIIAIVIRNYYLDQISMNVIGFNISAKQICTNTNGSYECSCIDGYRLNDNGRFCDGTKISSLNNGCTHVS